MSKTQRKEGRPVAQLERAAKKSQGLLPAHLIFLFATVCISLLVGYFFTVGWFVHVLILWSGPFILVVDLVNIVYCRAAITRARRRSSESL